MVCKVSLVLALGLDPSGTKSFRKSGIKGSVAMPSLVLSAEICSIQHLPYAYLSSTVGRKKFSMSPYGTSSIKSSGHSVLRDILYSTRNLVHV